MRSSEIEGLHAGSRNSGRARCCTGFTRTSVPWKCCTGGLGLYLLVPATRDYFSEVSDPAGHLGICETQWARGCPWKIPSLHP